MVSTHRRLATGLALAALVATTAFADGAPTFLGPAAYLSQADSPFDLAGGSFCLEDFEDGLLNVPGVSGNGTQVIPPGSITDSVDGDDGSIDGFGIAGHSYFSGSTGITFTFDPAAPGGLPTQAGIVWTDGNGTVSFEAFGPGNVSLGTIGPFDHADFSISGETAEDRFYGVINPAGISAIKLSNTSAGIEVDHLQYDNCLAATPTTTTTSTSTTTTTSSTSTTTTTTSSTTTTTAMSTNTTVTTTSVTTPTSTPTTSSTTATSTPTTSVTTVTSTPTTSSTARTILGPTTTTTLLAEPCAVTPSEPTFVSLSCRLAALILRVGAESSLGAFQPKLASTLDDAKARKEQAESVCRDGDGKHARSRLKRAVRGMTQYGHRLRGRPARAIPAALREELIAAGESIRTDLKTLKSALECPQDATAA